MHNLHLVVINAEDAAEACELVRSNLEEGGTDNWKTICGCVSEKGIAYNTGVGRWTPGDYTLQLLNKMVQMWIDNPPEKDIVLKIMKRHLKESQPNSIKLITYINEEPKTEVPLGSTDWYFVSRYAEHMRSVSNLQDPYEPFDILKDSFRGDEYAECGVSIMEGNGENIYVVFVDIHS